ncbi:MAG: Holliday junction branch migration protein RuvA [Zetaproteobacteria bacterium CG12_big_fil_rev_8_21_14_0_65_55_1124]|nr:MAG: Holliday junction DNA helicase RuvA [Zetaproteobacteria bacterium CG1_02_55_237]PIS19408.1 MAG: Holliday junction branch migration protein RuvA [Zetaproteobacteria bacterium CG08_land_8_20_14_0_20_55_17]PIW42978.1 MAG: Holliday junction branch migration protein RuvA [Zetaproteobacteria bacterium CG12_big_fil_rev_8_21_14_0_65_55_1124]PIY51520.1 MAG: Holliday junction branch migration protein RuvA [Zetaproteobacteria bacterium CG_4_10_14_0_8_um_filter_55_43]PIZ39206.1 MAG: Holliday juncti
MIGWLKGTVRELDPAGFLVLDVGGVGYDVAVSMQTLCTLENGAKTELFIHTHVREDQLMLFGFANQRERAVFRQLTGVSGIGARMGMNLLSGMSVEQLLAAIESADDAAIARTPGIGKKTAQRLILELKGKLPSGESGAARPAVNSVAADVRSALANLGYKPAQIDAAMKHVEDGDLESMFRAAMKAVA